MTGEDFISVWHNSELREYICMQARRHCRRNAENYEDMVQEAWLRLSLEPGDCEIKYYKRMSYNAIRNQYNRSKKEDFITFEDFFHARC